MFITLWESMQKTTLSALSSRERGHEDVQWLCVCVCVCVSVSVLYLGVS